MFKAQGSVIEMARVNCSSARITKPFVILTVLWLLLTVQSHRHLGKHRPVGGVFRYLFLLVAPHPSGT